MGVEYRLRQYIIDREYIHEAFTQGLKVEVLEGIPKDGRVMAIYSNMERNTIVIIVHHESFEITERFAEPPLGNIVLRSLHNENI